MRAVFLPILLSILLLSPIVIVSCCNVLGYIASIDLVGSEEKQEPLGEKSPSQDGSEEEGEEEEHIFVVDNFLLFHVFFVSPSIKTIFNKKPLLVFLDVQTQPPLDVVSV